MEERETPASLTCRDGHLKYKQLRSSSATSGFKCQEIQAKTSALSAGICEEFACGFCIQKKKKRANSLVSYTRLETDGLSGIFST